jgi:uncharacterized protein
MSPTERTYHDPLHGAITLNASDPTEALLIRLIDTPAFQRLRRIRQLGPASLTFHGGEGSRFTHSLGVMFVARRCFDRLVQSYPQLLPHRPVVLAAALLHDIGHGPFSHTAEEVFGSHHEGWTMRIIRESLPIRSCLDRFDPTVVDQLGLVYQKKFPIPAIAQLVSSQLDCDRLDYLMRDSYLTGATYGNLDLDRIILALRYDPVTQQLVVAQKGMAAIEHYLVVRYFMYAQVYSHPKNQAATWLLNSVMRRARVLIAEGNIHADATVTAWLTQDCNAMPLFDYLRADDGTFLYHLQQWQDSDDGILADLSRRFLDRDLFKAKDISDLSDADRADLLRQTQDKLQSQGLDPAFYTGLRYANSRGYSLYQRGINLQTPEGLREISERSPLIKTLIQPLRRAWLIHPRGVG